MTATDAPVINAQTLPRLSSISSRPFGAGNRKNNVGFTNNSSHSQRV